MAVKFSMLSLVWVILLEFLHWVQCPGFSIYRLAILRQAALSPMMSQWTFAEVSDLHLRIGAHARWAPSPDGSAILLSFAGILHTHSQIFQSFHGSRTESIFWCQECWNSYIIFHHMHIFSWNFWRHFCVWMRSSC